MLLSVRSGMCVLQLHSRKLSYVAQERLQFFEIERGWAFRSAHLQFKCIKHMRLLALYMYSTCRHVYMIQGEEGYGEEG